MYLLQSIFSRSLFWIYFFSRDWLASLRFYLYPPPSSYFDDCILCPISFLKIWADKISSRIFEHQPHGTVQPWWLHVPDEIRLEHGQAPTNLLRPCNQLVRPTPPVGDQHSPCCNELDEVTFMSSVNPLFGDIPGSTTRPTVIENNDAEFAGTNFLLGTDTNISAPNMDCLSIFDQLFDMPTAGTLQDQSHSLNHDPALSPEEESTRSFAASPAPKTGSTTAPRSLTRPFICEFRKKDGTICGHSCEKRCFLRYVRHFPVCSHRLSFAEDYTDHL